MVTADSSDSSSFGDFMGDIEQHVLNLIKETNQAPKDAWEAWTAFAAAIKWSEPWIVGLVCFHVVCLLLTIVFRKRSNVQGVFFLILCALVFLAEKINRACSLRWQTFSTQNYFDNRGVFASVMFAGPLLGIATIILINLLTLSSTALIKAKRLELRQSRKEQVKSEAGKID